MLQSMGLNWETKEQQHHLLHKQQHFDDTIPLSCTQVYMCVCVCVCVCVYTATETLAIPCGSEGKASACNAGDLGSIPGWRRSPGEGNGNPLQYSCLENPMDGEAWWATAYGVAKSRTRLSDFSLIPLQIKRISPESGLTFVAQDSCTLVVFWYNEYWSSLVSLV